MTVPPTPSDLVQRVRQRKQRRGQRGVALIMVLGALTILAVMLSEFQDESAAELGSALSDRDAVKAEYAAKSAVNLTRLLIAAEPTVRTAVAPMLMLLMRGSPPQIPIWAHADKVLGAFNDKEGAEAFSSLAGVNLAEGKNLGFADARFEVKIVDEDSKINVNVAAKGDAFSQQRVAQQLVGLMIGPQYDRMFEQRDASGNHHDRQTICSALVDWTDPDQDAFPCDLQNNTAQSAGAEDGFYGMLKRPYDRKNAAFDSLEELHMVRGVSDDFWATFIDPKGDPASRVLTVWGTGQVNVNTANEQTLLALVSTYAVPEAPIRTDPAERAKFLQSLALMKMFTPGVPIFGSPKKFIAALQGQGPFAALLQAGGFKPVQLISSDLLLKAITTESKVFSVYATGIVKAGKRETRVRMHTVVDFRKAPPPGVAQAEELQRRLQGGDAGAPPPTETAESGEGSGTENLPEGAGEDAIKDALRPSPGGTVIYNRLD